jgi:Icc-related predicted phosphoesterase
LNPPETVFKCPSNPKDVVENKSPSASQQHENLNNDSNSIDSLLKAVGLPDENKRTRSNANENNSKLLEKYLSKWFIKMKIIKSKKPCVLLTGSLLEADQLTIIEEKHNAGVIISRKEKDLVKTNNGLYRLLGKIIGGSPNELYQECLSNEMEKYYK